ncbi:MAG: tRNA glutamyl-Q(34) synthetase GluQRS [Aeromonadaceae bacterium]|nr:tRNA glutamyl-Q(34) synthetase GluQRS [Aeromonadaceae bacterium]
MSSATGSYTGRFAPSPSGPLHFGSLIAALGSYLQARHQGGRWLVRMEDLDPPREVPGAADEILRTLERFGLQWDGPVLYQSQRHERYQAILDALHQQGLTYHCQCSRARIQQLGGFYDGHCRHLRLPATGSAVRLHLDTPVFGFADQLLGQIQVGGALATEDFILKRRDGLFAYNLAVVIDDADSGVTQVVRGADLLEPTVRQIALYRLLQRPEPTWLHLPLALQAGGLKLSKQNHAPALPVGQEQALLWQALDFLGQAPDPALRQATLPELLSWAIDHWQRLNIPTQAREVAS